MTLLLEETVPGGGHTSLIVKRGQSLRLTDLRGGANVSVMMVNATEKSERLNLPDSLKCQHTAKLTAGHCLYSDMGRVLALLHGVDWRRAGLEGFGRPENYIGRQIDRWAKQYAGARVGEEPAMDRLTAWLKAHAPVPDETTIAHGDYRLGNLIIHPSEPRVAAVLDWELATLGHPLADLAYSCLAWRLPPDLQGIGGLDVPGLPTEAEYVQAYCRRTGRAGVPDLEFFIAFSLFRWAAIAAGVYRRALDGTAADARGREAGEKFRVLAEHGWRVARGA